MKANEDKTYLASKTKIMVTYITYVGIGAMLPAFLKEPFDIELFLNFILILLSVDALVFLFQYSLGSFSRVKFSKEGFIFTKYIKPRFVPWEDVYMVKEETFDIRGIRYYIVKTRNGNEEIEYLIEKNLKTKAMMEKFYFRRDGYESKLELFYLNKKVRDFYSTTSNLIIVGVFGALIYINKRILTLDLMIYIAFAALIIAIAAFVLYKVAGRYIGYKANVDSVKIKLDGETFNILWSDARRRVSEVEHLGRSKYDVVHLWLNKKIDGKYDRIDVPVSKKLLGQLKQTVEIVEK